MITGKTQPSERTRFWECIWIAVLAILVGGFLSVCAGLAIILYAIPFWADWSNTIGNPVLLAACIGLWWFYFTGSIFALVRVARNYPHHDADLRPLLALIGSWLAWRYWRSRPAAT